jgi:hypothetical protein
MSALSTPTARIRIPFFWWKHEVTSTARVTEVGNDGYLRCDTDYIPTSTVDMWRASRRHAA